MQYNNDFSKRCDEERIKDGGLYLDFDEIAKRGKLSKEEALLTKWYGVYQSRNSEDFMARIVIPGGKVTSYQARAIANMSKKYAKGIINITTRQAMQMHFLELKELPNFFRDIKEAGLSTFHGCGDVVRTIPVCPYDNICKYKRFDVYPYAKEAMKYLTDCRDLDNLPRKLKITFSGCSANCAQPYMNCIGVIATLVNIDGTKKEGFKITIGGGMGWKAFIGKDLFGFVPKENINEVLRAIAILFREYGDRTNRAKSRLKFVVENYGLDFCIDKIFEIMKNEGFDYSKIIKENVEDIGIKIENRPLESGNDIIMNGHNVINIIVPKGEISADIITEIAKLSEIYSDGNLYTDNRQNFSIRNVDKNDYNFVLNEINKLGFKTSGFFGLTDIVSCVGTTYCPKAVTQTRSLFDILDNLVNDEKYKEIRNKGFINITGCPNSCSPYRIADIGLRGMRIREETGSTEGYEILLGGSQNKHGEKLGEFKLKDCELVIDSVLSSFIENKNNEEFLRDFVDRKGIDYFRGIINELKLQ